MSPDQPLEKNCRGASQGLFFFRALTLAARAVDAGAAGPTALNLTTGQPPPPIGRPLGRPGQNFSASRFSECSLLLLQSNWRWVSSPCGQPVDNRESTPTSFTDIYIFWLSDARWMACVARNPTSSAQMETSLPAAQFARRGGRTRDPSSVHSITKGSDPPTSS